MRFREPEQPPAARNARIASRYTHKKKGKQDSVRAGFMVPHELLSKYKAAALSGEQREKACCKPCSQQLSWMRICTIFHPDKHTNASPHVPWWWAPSWVQLGQQAGDGRAQSSSAPPVVAPGQGHGLLPPRPCRRSCSLRYAVAVPQIRLVSSTISLSPITSATCT